jgi:RND family efflux transporter MFP subunit
MPSDAAGGRSRRRRWLRLGAGAPALLLAALLASGCHQTAPPGQANKAVEVVVTQPVADDVTDYQDFTGRLDAVKNVELRARVSGYVTEAPFKEGDVVHEGDLLFQIDSRSYRADLNQAEANLRQTQADRNLQVKNVERARRMVADRAIGKEEYDTMVAALEKSVATVGAMEAARDRAKLYLDYTRVTAPVTGRVSRRFVDPGNLVNADNTMLTTIVTENPLYAYFDVDERTYLDLVESSPSASGSWFSGPHFPVLMRLANEEQFERSGTVDFIDNRVVATSGTVRLRAVFDNGKGRLKPGLFVRIRLPIGTPYRALLVPDEALQSDQGRKYVYVVNAQDEVEYRTVQPGQAIQGLRVVKDGLKEGERVIVGGMQRVKPKVKVEAKAQEPPKKPESPLARLQRSEVSSQRSEVGGQKAGN